MATSNIIAATFENSLNAYADPCHQYDYGITLKLEGVELPATYEVHFSNSEESGESISMLGGSDGVQIPNQLLETGEYVYAFTYLHDTENDGYTKYTVVIPVIQRPEITEVEPTPHEATIIEQAVTALNEAVETVKEHSQTIEVINGVLTIRKEE